MGLGEAGVADPEYATSRCREVESRSGQIPVRVVMPRHVQDPPLAQQTDQALMVRIREGDRAGYRILLERYWTPLASYASGIVGMQDAAEDVVQDAFIRVWTHRAQWTPTGTVGAYLYRITRNLALNARRDSASEAQRRHQGGKQLLASKGSQDPAEDFATRSLQREVEAAIAALPERRREVFMLARYHGLSYREIGETMGIAVQTVANQMGAALGELREKLSRHLDEI
jgi:RNA polymerase sigma-70 factor, ECF subfamily